MQMIFSLVLSVLFVVYITLFVVIMYGLYEQRLIAHILSYSTYETHLVYSSAFCTLITAMSTYLCTRSEFQENNFFLGCKVLKVIIRSKRLSLFSWIQ